MHYELKNSETKAVELSSKSIFESYECLNNFGKFL